MTTTGTAFGRCGNDGGRGIGAGHTCWCVREAGHPLDSARPHGCQCGAVWADHRAAAPEHDQ